MPSELGRHRGAPGAELAARDPEQLGPSILHAHVPADDVLRVALRPRAEVHALDLIARLAQPIDDARAQADDVDVNVPALDAEGLDPLGDLGGGDHQIARVPADGLGNAPVVDEDHDVLVGVAARDVDA